MDTSSEALAALALNLAALLDRGDPVMMTASWARELRATMQALTPRGSGDGDDDSWLTDLPAPVWDAKDH